MKTPINIYPIDLGSGRASWLVNHDREMNSMLTRHIRYGSRHTKYYYSARLLNEQGEVEVSATYICDDGFCMSSGPVFRHTCTPYNNDTVARLIEDRKFEIAAKEYSDRQEQKWTRAVEKIKKEMFG